MQYIISFNEVKPQSHLPPWHLFFTEGFCLFKKNYRKDKKVLKWTHYSCRNRIREQMQYNLNGIKPHHCFFCITIVCKEGFGFSEIMCCLFCCFTRMEGHITYMQSCLLSKCLLYTYTSISDLLLKISLHNLSVNWFIIFVPR